MRERPSPIVQPRFPPDIPRVFSIILIRIEQPLYVLAWYVGLPSRLLLSHRASRLGLQLEPVFLLLSESA